VQNIGSVPHLILAALTIAGAVAMLLMAVRSSRRRRAENAAAVEGQPESSTPAEPKAGGILSLGAMMRPKDAREIESLKSRVIRAGLSSRESLDLYLTIRWSLILGGMLCGILLATTAGDLAVGVLMFMGVMGLALLAPSMWLRSRTQRRQAEISRALPGTLDLLVTCLDAGLGLEQAIDRVSAEARTGDDVLAAELRLTLAELSAGLSSVVCFRRLAARVGLEDINTLAAVIAQASTLGTNIVEVLRGHASAIRHHRMLDLEERAGKANAKLALPLTICLLPSILVLLLGPAAIMVLRSL
jgi:tight adherence protein C